MIENQTMYETTRHMLGEFQTTYENLVKADPGDIHPRLHRAMIDSTLSMIEEFQTEIAAYEARQADP